MATFLGKSTSFQQIEANVKLYKQKLNYPPGTGKREEITITRAKIGHSLS